MATENVRRWLRGPAILAVLLLLLTILRLGMTREAATKPATYTEVITAAREGKVDRVEFSNDEVRAHLKTPPGAPEQVMVADRIPNTDDHAVIEELMQKGIVVSGHAEKMSWWGPLLWSALPLLAIPMLFWLLAASAVKKGGRPMSFGKSHAKLYDRSAENTVTFTDVAGVDEAKSELLEIVRFLKEPSKYHEVGARVPKGVLLVGPPGTGKTLLARAVAGESGAPFFSLSGSEFVEMFVGVGASRVRDLFVQAKERAPCIIFIDELDAVGKTRAGAAGFAVNEEREQTLNQLLVEMDGFDSGTGLIIMAATNRPEILDRALLRAGRFDRQVLVDRPDLRGREAILRVHARKVRLGADVELRTIAQRTPGMVGADLANVVNEAALASVRRNSDHVDDVDFEEAIDRIQLGLKKEGRVMTDDEKRRVAAHEAGHALAALSVKHADPVHRVTIIPRSIGALGATLQLPTEERYLVTREELRDRLCVLLGGRSAEELTFGEMSTGAQDDLERATALARQMVCRFGMSDDLGPLTYGRPGGARFLVGLEQEERSYSEATAQSIDREVHAIVTREHERAMKLLVARRAVLERLTRELIAKETLSGDDLKTLVGNDVAVEEADRASAPATH